MKFVPEENNESGESIALYEDEIRNLIKLASPTKKDVFYDLGSGHGEIVKQFVLQSKIKQANGIEDDIKRFLTSIENVRDMKQKYLKRLEFWRSSFDDYDFSDATIVYNGIDIIGNNSKEDLDEIELYDKLFENKEIKIIKRDFPLIGYKPYKVFRRKDSTWFFMLKTPLKKYKMNSLSYWIKEVLGRKGTIDSLINHYKKSYINRDIKLEKTDMIEFKDNIQRVITKQFSSQ